MEFKSALWDLAAEFRSVLRGLVRKPGYAVAAWVMLGLAIAANAAVFAIVYGFLLKPLPYPQPQQLDVVRERLPKIGLNTPMVSVKTYLALKQDLHGIAGTGLSTNSSGDIATWRGRPHLLTFQRVTPSLFTTLGVAPILGRVLAPDTGEPGGPSEAVISWRFWQTAFDGSQTVLNQSFELEGKTYRIVGVMPRGFFLGTEERNAWLPYVVTPERAQNDNINYWMFVRRVPGVSPGQLNLTLLNYTQRMLAKKAPKARAKYMQDGYTIDAQSPRAVALNDSGIGRLPWLMQAAAALLLLLALANTINLGLVRQRARQQQFALRQVLGASRTGLVRLILLEHLPIAAAIGISAMLLAWAGVRALHAFGLPPEYSPFSIEMAPTVIVFTWVVTVIAVLV
ncbi:MAG: ABC transporter permease, partial [Gammaproteobacteria bacterium]